LAAEKNLEALIQAFEAVRQAQPQAKLVLVGDGPARKDLQTRVPDAVFAGMRHGDDLAAHYASGDLFVFPSLTETYGNVTAEAMASGTPVLAYDYAAASQLIQSGVNGQLAHFDNLQEFIGMARHLAEHPDLLQSLGHKARATALNTGWDRIIDVIESIYDALITGQPVPLAKSLPQATATQGQLKRLVSGVVARAPK
jgi:glycosyltransferase involved in cell wall biosynthesis